MNLPLTSYPCHANCVGDAPRGALHPATLSAAGCALTVLVLLHARRTGGLLSGPQQFVQQRVGALVTTMTGGTMHALFNISNSYGG